MHTSDAWPWRLKKECTLSSFSHRRNDVRKEFSFDLSYFLFAFHFAIFFLTTFTVDIYSFATVLVSFLQSTRKMCARKNFSSNLECSLMTMDWVVCLSAWKKRMHVIWHLVGAFGFHFMVCICRWYSFTNIHIHQNRGSHTLYASASNV